MRKLVEATFVSLDGVIESPERWALPRWGKAEKDAALRQLDEFDAFLLGRATYEKFAAAWSPIRGDPYFDRINGLPKFVPSTTLKTATWNATLIQGDVAAEVARLKHSRQGDHQVWDGRSGSDADRSPSHRRVQVFDFSDCSWFGAA